MLNDFSISICVPTYNGAAYLKEALESALQQTYTDYEILIVDDGSTDETLLIARRFEQAHQHIRVVQNPSNLGLVGNWTRCIELAKHRWIKFLFQDDIFDKDCLSSMIDMARHTGQKMVLCARNFIVDSNASEENKKYFQVITKPENLFDTDIITPHELAKQVVKHRAENILGEPVCLLFDKTILDEIGGFDERFIQLLDFEFVVRACFVKGLAFVRKPLVHFRVHSSQQSAVNSPLEKNEMASRKLIRTVFGDALLLFQLFLSDDRYKIMRDVWTERNLHLLIRYYYLRACRRFGTTLVRTALAEILPQIPEIRQLRYSYLKYKIAKFHYSRFVQEK